MNDAANKNVTPYRPRSKDLALVVALSLGVSLVLAALGLAFCLLAVGLMPGIATVSLFVKDGESARKLFGPPYHRHIWLVTRILVPVGLGIYFLAEGGFCGQNFICMLLR